MIKSVRCEEAEYPARLLPIRGMPGKLYYIGELPEDVPTVAIVGARACSAYGRAMARGLGAYLAGQGIPVVSGMAAGIDGYAHEGAIQAGGKTYAVLGCGADICYPRTNRAIYEALPHCGGILTEYPPGTPPLPVQFPARNRIISALADIVVVVEARKKSGSLITADFALEQGKSVMAFPGRVGDRLSEGTNFLIAQGAGVVWSFEAVKEELAAVPHRETAAVPLKTKQRGPGPDGGHAAGVTVLPPGLTDKARALYDVFGNEVLGIEALSEGAGETYMAVQGALLELLFCGAVREVSPGLYAKN